MSRKLGGQNKAVGLNIGAAISPCQPQRVRLSYCLRQAVGKPSQNSFGLFITKAVSEVSGHGICVEKRVGRGQSGGHRQVIRRLKGKHLQAGPTCMGGNHLDQLVLGSRVDLIQQHGHLRGPHTVLLHPGAFDAGAKADLCIRGAVDGLIKEKVPNLIGKLKMRPQGWIKGIAHIL